MILKRCMIGFWGMKERVGWWFLREVKFRYVFLSYEVEVMLKVEFKRNKIL